MSLKIGLILSVLAPASVLVAQDQPDQRLQVLRDRVAKARRDMFELTAVAVPSVSSGVPTAFGGSFGIVGVGASFQSRTRGGDKADGTMGLSLPLGDPSRVGFDIHVSALDLDRFGRRGSVDFKLHRLLGTDSSLALGVERALVWRGSDAARSFYAVYGRRFKLGPSSEAPLTRLQVNAGVGTGRFRRDADVASESAKVNTFGSAAVNLNSRANVFAEWNGSALNAGVSAAPFDAAVVLTLAIQDISRRSGDGGRLAFGVGVAHRF